MKKETQTASRETGGKSKRETQKREGERKVYPPSPGPSAWHGSDVIHPWAVCPFLSPPRLSLSPVIFTLAPEDPLRSSVQQDPPPFISLPKIFQPLGGHLLVLTPIQSTEREVCGRGYIFLCLVMSVLFLTAQTEKKHEGSFFLCCFPAPLLVLLACCSRCTSCLLS
jgi:hypothetical protein